MKVLVIGGTGFLGRHTVHALLDAGHSVRVFSRRGWPVSDDRIDEVTGSILKDEDLKKAVEGMDAVMHLAGQVSRDPEDSGWLMRLHVEGTRKVMSTCKDAEISRIIYMSTSGTIGVSTDPEAIATEENIYPTDLVRTWPYYLSKIYAEEEALRWHRAEGLPIVILNPTLLLGPGDEDSSSTGDVERFLKGQLPVTARGGMSFVDVRDVALASVSALTRGEVGERYLLGGCNVPLNDFFKDLARMSGRPAPLFSAPDSVSKWGAGLLSRLENLGLKSLPVTRIDMEMARHGWYISSEKAQAALGFEPRDPAETLRDTIDDVEARI